MKEKEVEFAKQITLTKLSGEKSLLGLVKEEWVRNIFETQD